MEFNTATAARLERLPSALRRYTNVPPLPHTSCASKRLPLVSVSQCAVTAEAARPPTSNQRRAWPLWKWLEMVASGTRFREC